MTRLDVLHQRALQLLGMKAVEPLAAWTFQRKQNRWLPKEPVALVGQTILDLRPRQFGSSSSDFVSPPFAFTSSIADAMGSGLGLIESSTGSLFTNETR